MAKGRGLSLLELIISLTIVLFLAAFFSDKLFNFDLILTKDKADRVADFINRAIIDSEFFGKGFVVIIDHYNSEAIQYEFKVENLYPCLEEYKLVCQFTEAFVPMLDDMRQKFQHGVESVTDKFKIVKSERLNFLQPKNVQYVILIDPYSMDGDFFIELQLKKGIVNIVINPILRIAKLT